MGMELTEPKHGFVSCCRVMRGKPNATRRWKEKSQRQPRAQYRHAEATQALEGVAKGCAREVDEDEKAAASLLENGRR